MYIYMWAQPPHTGCKGNHFYHRNVCVGKKQKSFRPGSIMWAFK